MRPRPLAEALFGLDSTDRHQRFAMQRTARLAFWQVLFGTELDVVHEGIPVVFPPEACYQGWQESLALLVEAEIPG